MFFKIISFISATFTYCYIIVNLNIIHLFGFTPNDCNSGALVIMIAFPLIIFLIIKVFFVFCFILIRWMLSQLGL